MFLLCGGGVLLILGNSDSLWYDDGSKFDLDLCMTGSWLAGLLDLLLTDKLPVDVADFSLLTSGGSSGAHGRGILDTQGVSGDGGAIIGDDDEGPDIMPAATL